MSVTSGRGPATTRTLLRASGGSGDVRRTVLSNGVRVVTEAMPTVRSVSFGVWIGVGSRDEGRSVAGASHYLEHLLFKGTRRRDAMAISAEIEAVGGEINAFTAKEYTCYYARVLDDDLPLAIDVVADMVTSSRITSHDVESERDVILEEIAMHDDEPGDAVHDLFAEAIFGDGPLGRPILGSIESIKSLSRSSIAGYYKRRYLPRNLVIAAAGNLDHRKVVRLVRKAFDLAGRLDGAEDTPSARRTGGTAQPTYARVRYLKRPTEQAHLILGMPGVARTDDRRFALGVLNAALGGGMSSRLFQEIREKRGLAYSVYSYASQYAETGFVGVYAGCHPRKVNDVLALCREQLAEVAAIGIDEEELARAKGQMRGGLVLGLEDTGSRMSRIGKAELVYDELLGIDDVLNRIEDVTLDDVRDIAGLLSAAPTLAVMSPAGTADKLARAIA